MAKPGPSSVNPSSKGTVTSMNVAGRAGKSVPQSPIPGPSSPGQPEAMRKALTKKSGTGGNATGAAGKVR
jgi:hypothetical protein